MKKNIKKRLVYGFVGLFVLMFALQFVAAGGVTVDSAVTDPQWVVDIMTFLKFGATWADLIIGLAILVMVFAATFDILGFTAFESDWVKYSIAGAISLVTAALGWVNTFAGFMIGIAGGSVVFATTIVIMFAALFFVIGSFAKGKMKALELKQTGEEAKGGYELAKIAALGHAKEAKAMGEAMK